MSELIVIGYPDEETAKKVLDKAVALQKDYLIDLEEAAVVVRDPKGKLHVTTTDHLTEAGALGGIFWGALIGLIFLAPLFGAALGGLYGAVFGKLGDLGLKESFKRQVGELLQPGTSAIMFVARKMTPDKVLEELAPYGGTVLRSSLDHEAEEHLQEALMAGVAR
ncbi:MAG TPA: DUF1269 domain-containing protein [Gaiellaceae bacterium]|nr:DUF1269 domain-containing protein [Gaiellaceae bacterium]